VQPDQGEQAEDFWLGGHEPGQQGGQPLSVVGQVTPLRDLARAAQVALVEQQVDHGQDAGQPPAEFFGGRHPVRDARFGAWRTRQPPVRT